MNGWDGIERLWDWLLANPPRWEEVDLGHFLRVIVPMLIILHVMLGIVNMRQAKTENQNALTRFIFAKAAFWGIVELAFHVRSTNLWVLLDALVVLAVAATVVDLGVRLFSRYVFGRV